MEVKRNELHESDPWPLVSAHVGLSLLTWHQFSRAGPGIWGLGTQNTGRGAVQRASSLRAEKDPCCPQAPRGRSGRRSDWAPGVQLDFQKEAGDQHNCPGTQTPAGGECGPAPACG